MVMLQNNTTINLLKKYIAAPSGALKESQLDNITASGPPLEILINSLEKTQR
jgi:hypothetical protein